MARLLRPRTAQIAKEIQLLIRTFTPGVVVVRRPKPATLSANFDRQSENWLEVYAGEALRIPAGGTVQLFGLGEIASTNDALLIAGRRAIKQGDVVQLEGRTTKVMHAPRVWQGYTYVTLDQWDSVS